TSLSLLFHHLCHLYTAPQQQSFIEDLYSTAKVFEKKGDIETARTCYQLSAKKSLRVPAHLSIAKGYQREKNINEAITLYQQMIDEKSGGLYPYIQLSKLLEHKKKDLPAALKITEQGLRYATDLLAFSSVAVQNENNDLQYRYMRLLRKSNRKHC
ncbi:MAG: tetratricopeptide repeat protein, partial [Clostridiales bacterium]|nr:tetratricopeptide repeat protein [Clostridiales bacterium]